MMDLSFLSHINYMAVLIASVIYFFIGFVWFSVLFGSMWTEELEKHNTFIKEPTAQEMGVKMFIAFFTNVLTSFGIACLIDLVGSATVLSGLILGSIIAICFAATTVANIDNWQSRSVKLFLLDTCYPMISIVVITIFLSIWR